MILVDISPPLMDFSCDNDAGDGRCLVCLTVKEQTGETDTKTVK